MYSLLLSLQQWWGGEDNGRYAVGTSTKTSIMAEVGRNGAVIEGISERLVKVQLEPKGKPSVVVSTATYAPTEQLEKMTMRSFGPGGTVPPHMNYPLENIFFVLIVLEREGMDVERAIVW